MEHRIYREDCFEACMLVRRRMLIWVEFRVGGVCLAGAITKCMEQLAVTMFEKHRHGIDLA